ncbi:MAG: hypothetical protein AAB932_03415, partial [Patescibacteria group bacterium]
MRKGINIFNTFIVAALSVFTTLFPVSSAGATTVGTNIVTQGTIEVDGLSYLDGGFISAGSSTVVGNFSAVGALNTTNNIKIGGITSTNYNAFSTGLGSGGITSHASEVNGVADVFIADTLEVNGTLFLDNSSAVSSTGAFVFGGGTMRSYNSLSGTAGAASRTDVMDGNNDLYVQGSLETDGLAYFDAGFISAGSSTLVGAFTTTDRLNIGGVANLAYNAFSTASTNGTTHSTDISGNGDVFIASNLETDGLAYFDAGFITTNASSSGAFAFGGGTLLSYNSISDAGGAAGGANISSDDDLYIEGALEVDGQTYFDNTSVWTLPAGSNVQIDASTTQHTSTNGIIYAQIRGNTGQTGIELIFDASSVSTDGTGMKVTFPSPTAGAETTGLNIILSSASGDSYGNGVLGDGTLHVGMNVGSTASAGDGDWFGNLIVWDTDSGQTSIKGRGFTVPYMASVNHNGGAGLVRGADMILQDTGGSTSAAAELTGFRADLDADTTTTAAYGVRLLMDVNGNPAADYCLFVQEDGSTGVLDYGLYLDGSLDTDIRLQNGETIHNYTNGQITFSTSVTTSNFAFFSTNSSTLRGDLTIDNGTLFVNSSTNRVGISTTTPSNGLDIYSSGTTTIMIDSNHA